MSNEVANVTETTPAVKRPKIAMEAFVTAWETSKSAPEVANKLGIKLTSVLARASKYRSEYKIDLKKMERKGGAKLDIAAAQAFLAKLRETTVS